MIRQKAGKNNIHKKNDSNYGIAGLILCHNFRNICDKVKVKIYKSCNKVKVKLDKVGSNTATITKIINYCCT